MVEYAGGREHVGKLRSSANLQGEPSPATAMKAVAGALDVVRYGFSGHQTFPFRYSWPPKGVAAVQRDPEVFWKPDALVRLGVGKNMVGSIRHWCEALGLLATSSGRARLTDLGSLLFGDTPVAGTTAEKPTGSRRARSASKNVHNGTGASVREVAADPFLEDPGTLWLLHWQLASRPYPASTWFLAFTRWNTGAFTPDDLTDYLVKRSEDARTRGRVSKSSLSRDAEVFLRTYVTAAPSRRRSPEDSFDCPLVELGLIRRISDGRYRLERAPRPSLPDGIFAFALADFWNRHAGDQNTLSVGRVLYDPGSPGAAFQLDEQAVVRIFERLPTKQFGFRYDETAGRRLVIRERPRDGMQILRNYYGNGRR